jgi:hypothetical protein
VWSPSNVPPPLTHGYALSARFKTRTPAVSATISNGAQKASSFIKYEVRITDSSLLVLPSSPPHPSTVTHVAPGISGTSSGDGSTPSDPSNVEGESLPEVEEVDTDAGPINVYIPRERDEFLLDDQFLMNWSLVINTVLKAIICKICGVAVIPQNVKGHFKRHHADLASAFDVNQLSLDSLSARYRSYLNFTPSTWIPHVLPSTPLSYINVKNGFMCVPTAKLPSCFRSFETIGSLIDHIRHDHPDTPGYTTAASKLQSVFQATRRRLFPVVLPTNLPSGTQHLYRSFLTKKAALSVSPETVESEERQLDPFLRTYRWYAVIKPFDKRQMFDQVALPVKHWEHRIKYLTDLYFDTINDRLRDLGLHSTLQEHLSIKSVADP